MYLKFCSKEYKVPDVDELLVFVPGLLLGYESTYSTLTILSLLSTFRGKISIFDG